MMAEPEEERVDVPDEEIEEPVRRRSARLALTELQLNERHHETPEKKNVSADEMIIVMRGPRRKPIVWSPVEQDRLPQRRPSKDQDEEPQIAPKKRPSLNSKLRRRLILSPSKNSGFLGDAIARKLMSLPKLNQEIAQN